MDCPRWHELTSTYERLKHVARLLESSRELAEDEDHREMVDELFHECCGRVSQLRYDQELHHDG